MEAGRVDIRRTHFILRAREAVKCILSKGIYIFTLSRFCPDLRIYSVVAAAEWQMKRREKVDRDQLGDYYGCPGKIKVAQIMIHL